MTMYLYLAEEQVSSIMTLSSSNSFWQVSLNLGSSQFSSLATLKSTLAPYCNFVISGKQSSLVSTEMFISTMLGIGLVIVISLSSISDFAQIVGSQGGASMYSSSDMPNLHLKCSNMGSNGLRSVGMRQLSLALSTTAALYILTISIIPEYIFENLVIVLSTLGLNKGGAKFLSNHTGNVDAVDVIVFTALPNGTMGLLHLDMEGSADVLRLMDVPGSVISGSLNNRAVAGMLLGTTKPEFVPKPVLNTEMITAPGNPAANSETSAATAAFYNNMATVQ